MKVAATRYDPKTAEPRQQARWAEADAFSTPTEGTGKPKYYVLEMFPYPSGNIHMGHARNYVMGDVVARSKRAQGFDVLHPMGWDAFGLPAENAAIERGIHPGDWTWSNIAAMRDQLKLLGLSLDWSREFATCDPAYYGQQQAWFLELFKRGLVYRKEAVVNWDPVDNTVLANEQVVDGRGWRSGAIVEKRKLNQWFLRITDYADDLIEGLKELEGRWPDKVRLMQENWIGRSKGLQMTWQWAGAAPVGGAIYMHPDNHVMHDAHYVPAWVKVSPFVAMLIGFGLAWLMYIRRPELPGQLAAQQRGRYQFLLNKWYFDQAYDAIFVRPARWIGRKLWTAGDGAVIDGAINGLALGIIPRLTRFAGRVQSGYLFHYAFAMVVGIVGLLIWVMMRGAH